MEPLFTLHRRGRNGHLPHCEWTLVLYCIYLASTTLISNSNNLNKSFYVLPSSSQDSSRLFKCCIPSTYPTINISESRKFYGFLLAWLSSLLDRLSLIVRGSRSVVNGEVPSRWIRGPPLLLFNLIPAATFSKTRPTRHRHLWARSCPFASSVYLRSAHHASNKVFKTGPCRPW